MTLATISPFAALGFAVVIALIVKVPMRLLGRWLERKGGAIERSRHGVLPGVGSAPAAERSQKPSDGGETPKRYDPFNAG